MNEIRLQREALELEMLSERAVFSARSAGRAVPEEECPIRTCFQRDTDRIIHSKSFRRLKHKTQVFLRPEGDHYRTRLTHTLEVSRIARTISRALRFNEDLTEAIALGHDLGHTPFGHAGERTLSELIPGGFEHNEQSLRVVERLEKNGAGLNLCYETRRGILCHTGSDRAESMEGRVVRLSDRIAYINHDVDDAVRAGILSANDIPGEIQSLLGTTYSQRINSVILDVIENSSDSDDINMSPAMYFVMETFRDFMFERVYRNETAKGEERKVSGMLKRIFEYFMTHPEKLADEYVSVAETEGLERAVGDYISGMTDNFAVSLFRELFIPGVWSIK